MPDDEKLPPDDTSREPDRDESTMIAPKVKVIFVDDDQTPRDFVLFALDNFLGYDEEDARNLAESVAEKGEAVVAELPAIPAELAKRRILEAAADSGYPFVVKLDGDERA